MWKYTIRSAKKVYELYFINEESTDSPSVLHKIHMLHTSSYIHTCKFIFGKIAPGQIQLIIDKNIVSKN